MVYSSELEYGRGDLETLSFLLTVPLHVGNLSLLLRFGYHPSRFLGEAEWMLTFKKVIIING